MQPAELAQRLAAAEAAVREAGRIAMDFYGRRGTLAIESKGVQDLVSEADKTCEDVIVRDLSRSFPGDGFFGEEGGARGGGAATWVIDPIDGTANFLRGINHWCLSIGLLAEGEALAGVIFDPVADELYAAARGGGAFLNGKPIWVSGRTDIGDARIGIGFSYRRPVAPHARDIEVLLDAHCEYNRLGSGALGMAYTAAGRFDGYWERHINAWDVMAGLVIVLEAGGRTNAYLSGDFLRDGNEILAATPQLFEPLDALLHR